MGRGFALGCDPPANSFRNESLDAVDDDLDPML